MIVYYGRDGQPLDMYGWAALFEDLDYKRVAQTTVGDYWVSTVWLGLNHNYGGGRPLIFETMVFQADAGGPVDFGGLDTWRYSTEEEAHAGHDEVVTLVRATTDVAP